MVRLRACLALLFVVLLPGAPSSLAGEAELTIANDFLVANTIKDDLYTFAAALELDHEGWRFRLWENAFTDSSNDVRFDETYATGSRVFALSSWWRLEAAAGIGHVGRGLLGESAQNALHRLIGDRELHLSYIDENRYHAKTRVGVWRPIRVRDSTWITPRIDVDATFGFRRDITPRASFTWDGHPSVAFVGGVGWRWTHVELDALAPWVSESGPTAEAGVKIRDHWTLVWTYNEYGTEVRHLRINYHWDLRAPRKQAEGESTGDIADASSSR